MKLSSNKDLSMRSDGAGVVLAVMIVFILGVSLWISNKTGADFTVALAACGKSVVVLFIAGFAALASPFKLSTLLALSLAVIYPLWWPVLDSIALNAQSVPFAGLYEQDSTLPWWRAWWFDAITEIGLIAFLVYVLFGRDRY